MPDGGTTRRRLLGLVSTGVAVAVAGCETTPEETTTTETAEPLVGDDAGSGGNDGAQNTSTASSGGGSGNDGSGDGSGDDGPTATSEPPEESTPTRTPTVVPVPPPNALRVADRLVSVRQDDYYTYVTVRLDLENTSDVTFTQLEFRVTVSYDPVDDEPQEVGAGYVERRWPEGNDPGFAPGETYEFTEQVRFKTDGRAGRSTDEDEFSFDIAYRRVAYR